MLQIKVQADNVMLKGAEIKCACLKECGDHAGEICREPMECILDLGRDVLIAACGECAIQIIQKAMEKLFR